LDSTDAPRFIRKKKKQKKKKKKKRKKKVAFALPLVLLVAASDLSASGLFIDDAAGTCHDCDRDDRWRHSALIPDVSLVAGVIWCWTCLGGVAA